MTTPESGHGDNDRYWWACAPEGWRIETWRGYVAGLEDAEAIVKELNRAK